MSERTLRVLAVVLAGVSFVLAGVTLILIWIGRDAALALEAFNQPESRLVQTLGALPALVVGSVITWRMPRNLYGWVWLVLGSAFSFEVFAIAYVIQGVFVSPGSLPLTMQVLSLGGFGWVIAVGMIPFVLLLFPTGRLPSRRWRPAAWVALAALGLACAVGWAMPGDSGLVPIKNPWGVEGEAGNIILLLANLCVFAIFGTILLGIVSVVVRYRRSTSVERQQLKWFAFGAVVLGIGLISDFFFEAPGVWEAIKEQAIFIILPVTIGVAILRYRLWDIDLIIRRTLTYALVVTLLAVVYFGSVVLLQQVFAVVSGQRSEIITVLSTLAIAALFVPLRNRIQAAIDRRFYRKKYDAQKVLQEFGETVRDETDLDKLTGRLLEVVQETMQPTSVGLWLKGANARAQRREDAKR